MTLSIPRRTYADLYGPTTGDRVRLADTELIIEVEKDFTVYGDEIAFGGGKVIRDGMGQSSRVTRSETPGALDLVITTAMAVWKIPTIQPLDLLMCGTPEGFLVISPK